MVLLRRHVAANATDVIEGTLVSSGVSCVVAGSEGADLFYATLDGARSTRVVIVVSEVVEGTLARSRAKSRGRGGKMRLVLTSSNRGVLL